MGMESLITAKAPAPDMRGSSSEASSVVPETVPQAAGPIGRVETLSTEFVSGWAAVQRTRARAFVYAMLEGEVISHGAATIARPDLEKARQERRLDAYAFMLPFERPLEVGAIASVEVFVLGDPRPLPR